MAPNFHPEYARALANNDRAFYRKTGDLAGHINSGQNAVSRKSNQLLEKSRLAGSMKPASGGVNSTMNSANFVTGNSATRISWAHWLIYHWLRLKSGMKSMKLCPFVISYEVQFKTKILK